MPLQLWERSLRCIVEDEDTLNSRGRAERWRAKGIVKLRKSHPATESFAVSSSKFDAEVTHDSAELA